MKIPLEGFRRPPTEALDVVFKGAVVSGMLCCSPARAVAGVAFMVLVAIVLEALPHLVDVLVSRESAIVCSESADTGHVTSPAFATTILTPVWS
jgi:hypothetical protein